MREHPKGHVAPEGCVVLGDKAYDSDDIRARIKEAGAITNIPPKVNRRAPQPFDAKLYNPHFPNEPLI